MTPLQHYRDLVRQLDLLDLESDEAEVIREKLDAVWNQLTDAQKYMLFTDRSI